MKKVAQVNLLFWVMKMCATVMGETAGDLLSMTLNVGYGISSLILVGLLLATLIIQLLNKRYHPILYWSVIILTLTAGTTMSDYMDRTLELGYPLGSLILITLLLGILAIWHLSEKTLSVENITTPKVEFLYWMAILFSNTLGTALGDFLADSSGLGFLGGASLIGGLLILTVIANYWTKISKVLLFWVAFILTRPFGATFGDLLTKPLDKGGLDLGTVGTSVLLASVLLILVFFSHAKEKSVRSLQGANADS